MASWFRSLTQTFTGVASEDFNTWLSDNYDLAPPAVPKFFEGSLVNALTQAQERNQPVLVWLHGQRNPLTDTLVKEVWASPELHRLLDQSSIICWAGDVWRNEPYDVAVALRIKRFPVVALLRPAPSQSRQPSHTNAFAADFVLQGEVQRRTVLGHLRTAIQQRLVERQLREMAQALVRTADAQSAEARRQREQAEVFGRQESEEAPLLSGLYESQYGDSHPEFLELGFAEAVLEAKTQGRLLLAWLRSSTNQSVDAVFGTKVWPHEVVQAFVSEHFLLWVGDVDRWLSAAQLRQMLQLPAAPALVALRPASVYDVDGLGFLFGRPLEGQPCEHPAGTAWQVLGYLDCSSEQALGDGEPVIDFLCRVGEEWETERREAEAQRAAREREREERRLLREQQDAEFQESLRVDQERRLAAGASTSGAEGAAPAGAGSAAAADGGGPAPPPAALGPEAVAAASAQAAKAREPTALELRRRADAAKLQERDAQSSGAGQAGERCKLVLRLPNGKRVERSFSAADRVADVYQWADCAGELACLGDSKAAGDGSPGASSPVGFEVPEHFVLCVTFPRQPLTDKDVDLKSAGLCPNAVLALSATDPPP